MAIIGVLRMRRLLGWLLDTLVRHMRVGASRPQPASAAGTVASVRVSPNGRINMISPVRWVVTEGCGRDAAAFGRDQSFIRKTTRFPDMRRPRTSATGLTRTGRAVRFVSRHNRRPTVPHSTSSLLTAFLIADGYRAEPAPIEVNFSALYDELKRLARRQLRIVNATLNTTELVHESFLKLGHDTDSSWENRAHFFGAAARAMRQVLVDLARRRSAAKRGGAWRAVSLNDAQIGIEIRLDEIVALDGALEQLDAADERLRRVVELRFFGGMREHDIARMLGVSTRTVERDWLKARLFLLEALRETEPTT
jgi:RNA polymerase sigma factor (TIGR02999 family)